MAFLDLIHIQKSFRSATAVEDFNLAVEKGEFISFLGPSGCGKTTTLRMIAGFETPTSGQILVDGHDLTTVPPNKRNIGMVFQSYALFPNLTVAGNIGFGLKMAGRPAEEIRQRVDEMLALIHLTGFGERYPYQLSGGQQQRIALARALAIRPRLLLLDEPLSALDAKIRVDLRSEIRRIQQELKITTIYVTHDQEEALSLSDRIVVMNSGHIEQIGAPFEIYNHPKTAFTATFVGHLNVIDAVWSGKDCQIDGQAVRVELAQSPSVGSQLRLAIRPEEINLGQADGHNQLSGVVQEVLFLGSIVRIRLTTGNARLTLDTFNERGAPPPAVGQSIMVHFPVDACWPIQV